MTRRCSWLVLTSLAAGPLPALAETIAPQVPGLVNPNLQREQIERIQRQRTEDERARRVEVPALRGEAPEEQVLQSQGERFELRGVSFNASV